MALKYADVRPKQPVFRSADAYLQWMLTHEKTLTRFTSRQDQVKRKLLKTIVGSLMMYGYDGSPEFHAHIDMWEEWSMKQALEQVLCKVSDQEYTLRFFLKLHGPLGVLQMFRPDDGKTELESAETFLRLNQSLTKEDRHQLRTQMKPCLIKDQVSPKKIMLWLYPVIKKYFTLLDGKEVLDYKVHTVLTEAKESAKLLLIFIPNKQQKNVKKSGDSKDTPAAGEDTPSTGGYELRKQEVESQSSGVNVQQQADRRDGDEADSHPTETPTSKRNSIDMDSPHSPDTASDQRAASENLSRNQSPQSNHSEPKASPDGQVDINGVVNETSSQGSNSNHLPNENISTKGSSDNENHVSGSSRNSLTDADQSIRSGRNSLTDADQSIRSGRNSFTDAGQSIRSGRNSFTDAGQSTRSGRNSLTDADQVIGSDSSSLTDELKPHGSGTNNDTQVNEANANGLCDGNTVDSPEDLHKTDDWFDDEVEVRDDDNAIDDNISGFRVAADSVLGTKDPDEDAHSVDPNWFKDDDNVYIANQPEETPETQDTNVEDQVLLEQQSEQLENQEELNEPKKVHFSESVEEEENVKAKMTATNVPRKSGTRKSSNTLRILINFELATPISNLPARFQLHHPLPKSGPFARCGQQLMKDVAEAMSDRLLNFVVYTAIGKVSSQNGKQNEGERKPKSFRERKQPTPPYIRTWKTDLSSIENYMLQKSLSYDEKLNSNCTAAMKLYNIMSNKGKKVIPQLDEQMRSTLLLHLIKKKAASPGSQKEWLIALIDQLLKAMRTGFCPSFSQPSVNIWPHGKVTGMKLARVEAFRENLADKHGVQMLKHSVGVYGLKPGQTVTTNTEI